MDWTKSFGRKVVGRKVGARINIIQKRILILIFNPNTSVELKRGEINLHILHCLCSELFLIRKVTFFFKLLLKLFISAF